MQKERIRGGSAGAAPDALIVQGCRLFSDSQDSLFRIRELPIFVIALLPVSGYNKS
jgi:hypothetical protein